MWSYYGAKTNIVDSYPAPIHPKIIEPFAGSARYSLKYFDRDVLLIDKYSVVIRIWQWLQQCSPGDITGLPRLKGRESLNDFKFDCEEAKLFMGFIIGCGSERPRETPAERKTTDRPNHINYSLKRIAAHLWKIKHWKFIEGDYSVAPVQTATYFVDPPYRHGGHSYVHSNRKISYTHLATWCYQLPGQVIVCENTKADWMNFKPMRSFRGSTKTTTEAIWSNLPTPYDKIQQKLFDHV